MNPLFTDPPDPGPIPEVLRRPVQLPKSRDDAAPDSDLAGFGAGWGMAMEFIVAVLAGLGLGWLIDRWMKSAPLGILIGLGLGFVGALVRIIRQTQQAEREEAAARARRSQSAR